MAYNYLHKEAKGFYMQLDFELDPSIYPIGSTFEDYRGGAYVALDDAQMQFHADHPEADVEEVINMQIREPEQPTPEEQFKTLKDEKLHAMYDYFNSQLTFSIDGVNCYVPYRMELKEQASRKPQIKIKDKLMDSEQAVEALNEMSNYYDDNVVRLNEVRAALDACETLEDLQSFDYESGYPDPISTTSDDIAVAVLTKNQSNPQVMAASFMTSRINTMSLSVPEAIQFKALYPVWGEEYARIGDSVDVGFRCRVNGYDDGESTQDNILVECIQAHTIEENFKPSIHTASLWKVVVDESEIDGSIDDPIPYVPPMELVNGKYYTEDGVKYLCNLDSGIPISQSLEDLVDIYVTVVEE